MRIVRAAMVGVAVVTLAAVAGCGSGEASSASGGGELGTLRMVYGAPPETASSAAPFAVALQQGYWEDEGLEVDIKGLAGGPAAVQALITGQGDLSVSGTSTMLSALAEGSPQPILSFFSWIVKPTYAVSVPEDSEFATAADLEGEPIGVENVGKDDALALANILSIAQGVDESEIDLVPVGAGPQALQALESERVSAYAGGDTGNAQLNALGLSIRDLVLPSELEGATDTVWVTTPEFFEDEANREKLAAFGRGLAKAQLFCQSNVDACIKLYWKQYPTAAPSNAESDFEEASAVIRASLEARLPKLVPVEARWGYQTTEGFEAMAAVQGIEGLDTSQIETLYSNDLTEQFSDFDAAEIEDQATNFSDE